MSQSRTIHILFHEQAVCGRDTKWEKADLMSVNYIVMWLYQSQVESATSLQFKEYRQK